MTSRAQIDDFLGQKRLAMVGVSRNPKDFSRGLFRDLRSRGYEVTPVNPGAAEIDGVPAFSSLHDITPAVDGVLLMTSPAVTEQAVEDCATAGIRRVWMYRAAGQGAVSSKAVEFCEAHGISVIAGECPYMFLRDTNWLHRMHGCLRKITGRYPA
jgi:uncharacterized protein